MPRKPNRSHSDISLTHKKKRSPDWTHLALFCVQLPECQSQRFLRVQKLMYLTNIKVLYEARGESACQRGRNTSAPGKNPGKERSRDQTATEKFQFQRNSHACFLP
ncbi:uncharacterized protein LOC124894100 isoform X1 [Capsicum annuum]|uniref:uncharacterized protein LOC124894100 isoform X1 n=1 Tax=Capsicum annuum TaxID=4072 RepID=UPI001FB10A3C|nr:uncharacterized protein LOC124894100 isoform X1 [Capsicum annuum]XP_047260810.1 uncharacterized protein LOC124894100 isoform X1 [Capsicum annuum]